MIPIFFFFSLCFYPFPICTGPVLVGLFMKPFILSGTVNTLLSTGNLSVGQNLPAWINDCLQSGIEINTTTESSDLLQISSKITKWRVFVGIFIVATCIAVVSLWTAIFIQLLQKR